MKTTITHFFGVLLLLVYNNFSFAQTENWMRYRAENTGTNNFVDNKINDITKDNSGNIWIATQKGVMKYDGLSWTVFNSYSNFDYNYVAEIEKDNAGVLWFISFHVISKFDGTTWTILNNILGLSDAMYYSASKDMSGNIWVASSEGLLKYDGSVWSRYSTADGMVTNHIELVKCDNLGNVWFSSKWAGYGVTKYNGSTFTTYTSTNGLANDMVQSIVQDNTGNMWFGTEGGGLSRFNGSTWTTYTNSNTGGGLASDYVYGLYVSGTDLYAATTWGNGLSKFNGSTWSVYNTSGGLVSNNTISVFKDGSILYIGTQEGLSVYNGISYTNYSTKDGGLVCNEINDIFRDHNNKVWIATENGVSKFSNNQFTSYSISDGLNSFSARSISEDASYNIWIGTNYGLNKFNGSSWTQYHTSDGLADNDIRKVLIDNQNNIWIATANGVSKYNGSTFTNYKTPNGLAGNDVNTIYKDNNNNLWFGTTQGVSKFNGSVFTNYTTSNGLSNNDIRAICQDNNGDMWFGSWGGGISKLSGSTWSYFTIADGLGSDNIRIIVKDKNGTLWIGNPWMYVYKYDGSKFSQLKNASVYFSHPDVRAICEVQSNNKYELWFGAWDGGVSVSYSYTYDASLSPVQFPIGTKIPSSQAQNGFSFGGRISNIGSENLTNLNLIVNVDQGYWFGSNQLFYLPFGKDALLNLTGVMPTGNKNSFNVSYSIKSAENDLDTTNNIYQTLVSINDSVYAIDDGTLNPTYTSISKGTSRGGIFQLTQADTITSISVYFTNSSSIGGKFSFTIFKNCYENSTKVGEIVYTSPVFTISANDLDKWTTWDFDGFGVLLDPGSYYFGIKSESQIIRLALDNNSFGYRLIESNGTFVQKYENSILERINFGHSVKRIAHSTFASLDINNIRAGFNAYGQMFNYNSGSARFEVPIGSGVHSIFASNIWIGGLDEKDSLHLAAQRFNQDGYDFFSGPVAFKYDDEYDARYNRIWKISKSDIEYHRANWRKAGYLVPASLLDWPAHGNTGNNEAFYLAPFVDFNNNNIYDPENGDYPSIRGDQAVFMLYNDHRMPHTESKGEMLGVEIHCMAYAFNAPDDSMLNNTIFVNYAIKNRSAKNYHNVLTGIWSDPDIGYGFDDYIGCDTALNTYFCYNANSTDQSYGNHPAAQGITFLSSKMSSFSYFNNVATGIDSITKDPRNAVESYNYLMGKWRFGSPITEGGTGYGGTKPVKYVYPGDPVNSTGWSEVSEGNAFGDRRGIGVIGPFDLNAGEELCIDIAFPNARHYAGNNLNSISLLRQRVKQLNHFYNSQSWTCNSDILLRVNISTQNATCNKSDGNASVTVSGGIPPYRFQWSSGDSLANVNNLAAGIYTVVVKDADDNTVTNTVLISNSGGPAITVDSIDNISCNGRNDGGIFITASSSAKPFTYLWSNKSISEDITALFAGEYSLIVIDTNKCKTVASFTVKEPEPLNTIITSTNSDCGKSNGIAIANPIGGTPPYSFLWSNSKTTYLIDKLGFGDYSVLLTDKNGCKISKKMTISELNGPVIKTDTMIYPDCGKKNGAIKISTTGGTGYYDFLWSTGWELEDISSIGSGEYSLIATDFNKCRGIALFELPTAKPAIPEICLVTVDNSGKNLIAWERSNDKNIKQFNIYRESSQSGNYQFIGTNDIKDLTVFIDTLSDPRVRSWRYRMSIVDNCKMESELSNLHKTIHLTANKGLAGEANLIWDNYQGFPYSSYSIYRGTNPTEMKYLTSIQSSLTSYTDKNPPAGIVFYMISANKGDTCYPSSNLRGSNTSGPYSQSLSNLKDYSQSSTLYLVVSEKTMTIKNDSGSKAYIAVFTNALEWDAVSSEPWINLSVDRFTSTLTATASENTSEASRTAIITVSSPGLNDQILTIIQSGMNSGLNEDRSAENNVRIFPNPVTSEIYFSILSIKDSDVTIEITDMYGKSVAGLAETFIRKGEKIMPMNLGNLPVGIYFARIQVGNQLFCKKILKL